MDDINIKESCSSMCEFSYHVFLSFRGDDTRKNFTDHLYTALKWAGIRAFRDDDAIERGAVMECEVEKAIRQSKMSLIVFSRDFASSSWCLDEVAMIMEHRETTAGSHIVLSVFYDVDPSEVQNQTGSFAKGFYRHNEDERIEGWRSALRNISDLAGMVLENRHEAKFIQDIVKKVGEKLKRAMLYVPSYLVGIDCHVNDINNWIQDRPEDVGIAIIHGLAGVGKTTIAKTVFNLNFEQFDCWSFLKDVRETSKQYNGLVQLQMQILSDMLKGEIHKINNVDDGIIQIRHATWHKKVLIVLDDVDDVCQFKSIIAMGDWLYKGSKIIITTRHGRLLSFHNQPCENFCIMPLGDSESLQLFSWHAFRHAQPIEDYLEDSKIVVRHCGGLPLALEVLGFSLSRRTKDLWKRAIKEPEALDGGKIHKILRVSYDSLQDDRDTNLFLDIACFFIGEDITFVYRIVESCDFYRNVGIQELIDRYLISVDKDNKLVLHQLLRDMGREIVRQESPDNHGERTRIWRHNDSFKILRKKTGSRSVKSFILDWEQVNIASKCLMDLNSDAFASMGNLKLTHLNNLRLKGGYENFPKGLVWLCWRHVPWDCIPINFYLEDLIVLDLSNSSLRDVWHGIRIFPVLKILNLSHCHGLITTPDFSGLLGLEILILEECINLARVHKSIGDLQKLTSASLKDCVNLKRLPNEMCMLKSLQSLILSGCSKLDEIPNQLKKMEFLWVICADGPLMSQFQNWASRMYSWLMRQGTLSTKSLIDCLPSSLVKLSLADCNLRDDVMLNNLSTLPCLEFLDLSGNPLQHLPESINSLTRLDSLVLQRCTRLKSLPSLPSSLETVLMSNFGPLLGLLDVYIFGSKEEPDKLQGLFKLDPMNQFDMEMIYNVGLQKSESVRITQGNNFDAMTTTQGKTIFKVFHDGGIRNLYVAVREIPDWFCLLTGTCHARYCKPSGSYPDICGLNIFVVYTCYDQRGNFGIPCSAKIRIEAKDKDFEYSPEIFGIPEANEDMLWLSHWTLSYMLETGDSVACSVILPSSFQVKKFGIHLVYPCQNPTKKEDHNIQYLPLPENSS